MIRINLLPFRAARRKENIRRQVSVFVLMVVFFALTLFYHSTMVNRKIERINTSINAVKAEIEQVKAKADKVTEIKRKLAILDQKLDLVGRLEEERKEPLTLLESMMDHIVTGRMWLTNLDSTQESVTLKGIAFDNKTVADFMTRLETDPMFASVDLKKLEKTKITDEVQMPGFEILCNRPMPAEPEDKKP